MYRCLWLSVHLWQYVPRTLLLIQFHAVGNIVQYLSFGRKCSFSSRRWLWLGGSAPAISGIAVWAASLFACDVPAVIHR